MILRSGRFRKSFKKREIAPRQGIGAQFLKRRAARFAASRASGMQRVFPVVVPGRNITIIELKFHDVDLDDAAISTTGDITASINLIPQGVTEKTRVGRKCTIKQIAWRFTLSLPAAADQADPPPPDIARVIMYLDKQANQATATVADILESTDYQSFNNLSNKKRFRILMSRNYDLEYQTSITDGTNTGAYPQQNMDDSFFKKVNIPIEFNSTTGAIGEITSNNLGVLLISKNGAMIFGSKIRLRFSDI